MNNKKEDFKNSLKVIPGGLERRKEIKIDIPLDEKKEKEKYKNTWEKAQKEIERYKELVKKARSYTGKDNSFAKDETITKLEKAIEDLKKADIEYSEIERKIEEAKKTIDPSEEWKLQELYEEELLKESKLAITSENFEKIFENYKSEVEREKAYSIRIPLDPQKPYNEQHSKNTVTSKKILKKADVKKQNNKKYNIPKRKHKKAKRIAKKIATIGAVMSLVAGGTIVVANEIRQVIDKPINIQTAEEFGKTPEQMGISEETADKILELNEKLQMDHSQISMNDVKQMAIDNYQVSQEVLEEKFSDLLKVEEEDIKFDTQTEKTDNSKKAYAYVGDKTYKYDNFIISFDNNMPKEVGTYIINLEQNRQLLNDLDYGNCNKEDAIKKIEKSIDNASRLAGGQDFYLEGEKINVNTTRNSDLEKQNDEKDKNSSAVNTKENLETDNER